MVGISKRFYQKFIYRILTHLPQTMQVQNSKFKNDTKVNSLKIFKNFSNRIFLAMNDQQNRLNKQRKREREKSKVGKGK